MIGEPAKIEIIARPCTYDAGGGMRVGMLHNESRELFTVSGPVRVCG